MNKRINDGSKECAKGIWKYLYEWMIRDESSELMDGLHIKVNE